jgi:adhesin transport system membrane fusion protein
MNSPVKGIVKKVNISTVGGVVKPGEELVEILPIESDLIIEAKIQPLDMSNLKKGLVAYIKLDAYDYSIYGSMKGEVEYISPDALMEQTKGGENIYYKVKIRIKQDEFKEKLSKNIQIDPGMTVGVDIKTGQRTVLTYLLKPIIKTLNQSLNEK